MPEARFLTKSKFKLASECPTKLFYTGKSEYGNLKIEDSFLAALADGGFQVGALAKCYFPGGIEVETRDYDRSVSETNELLSRDEVVIFEAAFRFENFYIRADIVCKSGNHIELIEVKAKSFDGADETAFLNKNGTIQSGWLPYLQDVAFQKFVIRSAFPGFTVTAALMMVDKNASCPTDGLNQKFKLKKYDGGARRIEVSDELGEQDLSTRILCKITADSCCDLIYSGSATKSIETMTFVEKLNWFADHYSRDKKIITDPSPVCKTCEFRAMEAHGVGTLKSGFHECWSDSLSWQPHDFEEPTILDIWNFRKKEELFGEGRIKISAVTEVDIAPKPDGKLGLSASERRWKQVEMAVRKDPGFWIHQDGLRGEIEKWKFPLHFIDFETSMPAIPFSKGRRPYEGIAFQYSHHIVDANGRVEHRGQYLDTQPGRFPSYDFLRSLKQALERDDGTIFQYSNHENTYLNFILKQLIADKDIVHDYRDLCEFIKSITTSTGSSEESWAGDRSMIDLCELVKRFYYDPFTNGSNSIKHVLPAILNRSAALQDKYSKPIYGAADGIRSLNFTNQTWVTKEGGRIVDPYKLLPKMFSDISEAEFDLLLSDADELRDGGAALTAYARLQFEEMSDYEREEIQTALLKYCELDTLAMVMLYEGWIELVS